MSEVLHFEYEATGPSIRVVVDTVNEAGVTVIGGAANPTRHMTLAKLASMDPELARDLQSVLSRLEPIARRKAEEDAANPNALRDEANRIANERMKLEREQAAAELALDLAKVEAKRIALEMQARQEEHEAKMKAEREAHEASLKALAGDALTDDSPAFKDAVKAATDE